MGADVLFKEGYFLSFFDIGWYSSMEVTGCLLELGEPSNADQAALRQLTPRCRGEISLRLGVLVKDVAKLLRITESKRLVEKLRGQTYRIDTCLLEEWKAAVDSFNKLTYFEYEDLSQLLRDDVDDILETAGFSGADWDVLASETIPADSDGFWPQDDVGGILLKPNACHREAIAHRTRIFEPTIAMHRLLDTIGKDTLEFFRWGEYG